MGFLFASSVMMVVGEDPDLTAKGRGEHFRRNCLRRSFALNATVLQAQDMVGMLIHHARVVRNEQNRHAGFSVQLAQQIVKVVLILEINTRGRLVQQ